MTEWLLTNVSLSCSRTRISYWQRVMQPRSLKRWKESKAEASGDTNVRNQNEEEGMTLRTERSVVFDQSYWLVDMEYSDEWFIFCFAVWRSLEASCDAWVFSGVLQSDQKRMFSFSVWHDGLRFIMMGSQMIPIPKWSYIQLLYDEEFEWESRDQTVSREQVRGDFSRWWKVCSDWLNELIFFLKY